MVAILSKMFSLAIKWGWRADNPTKGIERNREEPRHRYLSPDELVRLTTALAGHDDRQAADIVRMLLLTGSRSGEVQAAKWDQFDLEAGHWTKPASSVKQKTQHRTPLSAPTLQLLNELREKAPADAEFVFPGRMDGHRVDIHGNWAQICKAADISAVRLHDLRHTFASVLASSGLSLPIIGALLGHRTMAATAKYAHLYDDPLRAATERAAAIVTGKPSAEIVEMKGKR